MARLSMTDFIDVVSKNGIAKAKKVKEIKYRPKYQPGSDYYKLIREEVAKCHKGGSGKEYLKALIHTVLPKKVPHYQEIIDGYCKWWGRKSLKWFSPPSQTYAAHGFEISVNPEVGLEVDGERHLIKLYFKDEPLSKQRINIVNHLMETALRGRSKATDKMAILDVRNSKLITPTGDPSILNPVLQAEMAYIAALWPSV